ncbi:MAG: hypothetical protein IPN40_15690 [Uliginosibacterium sp.]|nr:hypothetical protein [Uliginosibacterium sp.]
MADLTSFQPTYSISSLMSQPLAPVQPAKPRRRGSCAVFLGRLDTGFGEQAAQQRNQAVGMQTFVGHIPPAVDLAEHRTLGQPGQVDPGIEGRHGT